jgi:upstream activation factor subunit UAF30
VSKALWAYIKSNDLQDPKDKRNILCDDKLKTLFQRDKVNMFKMNKYISEV